MNLFATLFGRKPLLATSSVAGSTVPKVSAWPPLRRETRAVRNKYRYLYELPVLEDAQGNRAFHEGRLFRCHGLNVLALRGDFVEMAFQHGRLLRDQIPGGALNGAARLLDNAIANAWGTLGTVPAALVECCERVLSRGAVQSARHRLLAMARNATTFPALVALSEGAGIPVEQTIRALFNPEMLLVLARYEASPAPVSCCSSFAAWGSYTRDGNPIIGRNMDYPLNGYYDSFPTVIYYEPTPPALRHMSFTSAGVHNAGITSYNEAGLFLGSHVVPGRDVSFGGVPALLTADLAAGHSASFEAAAGVLQSLSSPAGWSYFIAGTKEGRIGSLEKSHGHTAVRHAQGEYHIQTNRYQTPELSPLNLSINASIDDDSGARWEQIRRRLESARGKLDAQEALSILSDQTDPTTNQVRGLGNTVAMHATLTSIVLDSARKRVLVATGRGPACHGEYVELPLVGACDPRSLDAEQCRVYLNTSFPKSHPEKFKAQQLFIRAKKAYEYDNDFARAYELLQQVVQWDSANPSYYFQLGIFALKNRKLSEALDAFDDGLHGLQIPPHTRRLMAYYRGRTLADLGKASEALAEFAAVTDDPETDARLRAAARRAAWRTKLWGRLRITNRSLNIMMQQSDMFAY